jgi:hypothetical protein
MNVRELIDALEDIAADVGDHVEVRLAYQPRWPFEYGISDVQAVDLSDDSDEDDDDSDEPQPADPKDAEYVVYLVEAEQLGYLPGAAAKQIGWER